VSPLLYSFAAEAPSLERSILAYEGRDDRVPDGPVVSAADERGGLEEALRVQRSEEELRASVREREAGQVNGSWATPWVVPGEPGPAAVDRSKNETKLKARSNNAGNNAINIGRPRRRERGGQRREAWSPSPAALVSGYRRAIDRSMFNPGRPLGAPAGPKKGQITMPQTQTTRGACPVERFELRGQWRRLQGQRPTGMEDRW
jgi:hypothetical protein